VIKTVMALREGVLPKTLHVDAPSSHVDWEAGAVELLTESVEWEAEGRPRRAGVSSFGVSGTNAHLILEQAPAPEGADKTTELPAPALGDELPFVLSAKQPEALRELAERLSARLGDDPELELGDLAYSLATTRADLGHRAVVVAGERSELLAGLGAIAAGEEAPNLVLGTARLDRRPAFLFPGQGSQWQGMALELAAASAPFAAALDACEQALEPFVEWSLREVLSEAEGAWLERLDVVQPALFAVMVSLAKLWQACGVEPAVVLGHSQGEIAAAHVAGGLGLDDAARVVALRARAMATIAGQGAMASVSVPERELEPILAPFGERVSLAAVNGPASLILSGEVEGIEELIAGCERSGVRAQRIAVDYAAHSAQIEALREELLEAFAPISPVSGEVPFHSTLTGERIDTAELGPEYWYRNLREPVRLEPVIRALIEGGTQTFVEVGPHPVLGFAVQETIDAGARPGEVAAIGTLRRDDAGPRRFALSLAEAHAGGARPDWDAFFAGTGAAAVPLPTYPFQRQRYWLSPSLASSDPSAVGQAAAEHPLLGARIEDARGEGLILTGRISLQTHPWLADHRVGGTILLPGTAFVELALRAGVEAGCERLAELALQAPLAVPESGGVSLQVLVGAAAEDGGREVSIHSRAETGEDGEDAPWTCHAEGLLSAEAGELGEALEAWPPAGAEPVDGVAEAYDRLAEIGFEYGPAFQGLSGAWRLGDDLYVEVSLDEEQASEAEGFEIHPALFDSVLHGGFFHDGFFAAMGGGDIEETGGLILPFAWTDVRLGARGATSLRVRLGTAEGAVTLHAFDRSGAPVLAVEALVGRAVSAELLPAAKPRSGGEGLLGLDWAEVEAGAPDEAEPAELVALAELLPERPADPADAARAATRAVLELAKQRIADGGGSRLVLLSEGALAVVEGEGADLAGAAVWGLLRSAQSEHPGRFALIDSDGSEASRQALEQAVAISAGEPQLALREGAILAPRLCARPSRPGAVTPPPGPWSLVAAELGTLDGLTAVSLPLAADPLAPGAVRIEMRAAGLNFRDVMTVLGVDPAGGAGGIGGEGAGVVAEVGAEVEGLAVGDRVAGLIPAAFGSLAVADARPLARIPEGWSFEQAAAVPMAYCTAWYGLRELADLQPGQRVLIHAAAGGVGSAAVAIAQQRGAEVFATASPSKWEALEAAGIPAERIASSRDLEFEQRFLELTGGEGVDVVLNSLAGDFVDASLRLLPRGGRFLEMGKTDIRDPEQVAAAHSGVAYGAFDLRDAGLEGIGRILAELVGLLDRGDLRLAEPGVWDLRRAPEAFRHLREGRNVGKVVLRVPRAFDPDRTVLVTGATGGLGSLLARHLVEAHGVRHLLLLSRAGAGAEGAGELRSELEELGAEPRIEACDVADRERLGELIGSIDPAHPLGAVVHAAGVVEDGLVETMEAAQLERVLAPKLDGAWNLHELTAELDLSTFVTFSSLAATIGGPGQGNYAAANLALDALAARRQAAGLAGTSIAWGLWERETGLTGAVDKADRERLRRVGFTLLSDRRGLELFDAALAAGAPFVAATDVERSSLGKLAAAGMLPPILSGLARQRPGRRAAPTVSLAERLAQVPAAEHEAAVLKLVREEVAAVLGYRDAAEVPADRPFNELGVDSLAAVELRNRLSGLAGTRLATTIAFDYPTAEAVAGYLLAQAKPSEEALAGGELERLGRTLSALPAGDEQRAQFASRLRSLAADLEGGDGDGGKESKASRIEAASDEELLELIDAQVGGSR
jgi:acyl transferase domain-containing protein/NADPH:quinone reductase-like Zn-dependent oxidoreductase/acyl carrier protein